MRVVREGDRSFAACWECGETKPLLVTVGDSRYSSMGGVPRNAKEPVICAKCARDALHLFWDKEDEAEVE